VNVLIVYANEKPTSFNAAMRDTAVTAFRERGDTVVVSDLYAMGFKAVADRRDFLRPPDPGHSYQVAQRTAAENDLLGPDIVAELDKLLRADLAIFQFPLWWFSMPAIMKGWIERVVVNGRLYSRGRWYGNGVLRGKKALLAFTTGAPASSFRADGINLAIEDLLLPIHHGFLQFVGMDVLSPFVAYSAAYISDEERQQLLAAYRQKLLAIDTAPVLTPPDVAKYDQDTWQLL
jgi:NAD(P)H dehydrogenase (quinone)